MTISIATRISLLLLSSFAAPPPLASPARNEPVHKRTRVTLTAAMYVTSMCECSTYCSRKGGGELASLLILVPRAWRLVHVCVVYDAQPTAVIIVVRRAQLGGT